MVAAQGAFKQSIPVVTVYTNLGEEAVRHSLEVSGVDYWGRSSFGMTTDEHLGSLKKSC